MYDLAILEGDGHFDTFGNYNGLFLNQIQIQQVQRGAVRETHQFHPGLDRRVVDTDIFIIRGDVGHAFRTVVGPDLLGVKPRTCKDAESQYSQFLHYDIGY